MSYYRFSISWSRVLPEGTVDKVNPPGVRYYNKLIDTLLANGIKPAVTLYHFDLPQALQDVGGWRNPNIAGIFNEYARFCFKEFGDRVGIWLTINEPHEEALDAYGLGAFAPGIKAMEAGPYQGKCTDKGPLWWKRVEGGGNLKFLLSLLFTPSQFSSLEALTLDLSQVV